MKTGNRTYLLAVAAALAAVLLPFYVELAVGIVDPPGGPILSIELGVLAVGIVGAVVARLRPHGMARALVATALAQAVAAGLMLIAVPSHPASPPLEVLGVNAMFIALFCGSAWLFRRAARKRAPAGA